MRAISVKVYLTGEFRLEAVLDGTTLPELEIENLRRRVLDTIGEWSRQTHYSLAQLKVSDLTVALEARKSN